MFPVISNSHQLFAEQLSVAVFKDIYTQNKDKKNGIMYLGLNMPFYYYLKCLLREY